MIQAWQRFRRRIRRPRRHRRSRHRRSRLQRPQDAATQAQTVLDVAKTLRQLGQSEFRKAFDALRHQIQQKKMTAADTTTNAFAFVTEAARRTLSVDYYQVQVQAGLTLANGAVAEMKTGEGKTLAAAFPSVVWATQTRGVHVMTCNDYLAARDEQSLRPLYESLGLKTAVLTEDRQQSQAAYDADITYGSGDRFAFDYLFEQLEAERDAAPTIRRRAFAVIDEADSVMIDEASSPLIVSVQPQEPHPVPEPYIIAESVASQFEPNRDYLVERGSQVRLHPDAHRAVEKSRQIMLFNDLKLQRPWEDYIRHAITAHDFLLPDVNYIVQDGEILFVDQHTGRIFAERTWRDGLHQAIQAKERVVVTNETKSAARITRQRFFNLYEHKCGMTGTAVSAAREFHDVYDLQVNSIPLRTPCLRVEFSTRYFGSEAAKWRAIVEDVLAKHSRSQPILVGTATITASEQLAVLLQNAGVRYQLLNGKQDEEEATIIAGAGRAATITIATNMAGRGADIRIDDRAKQMGGLHVISAQRHVSSRIDRQLIGRCARQGAPGSCQFFVSADDELFVNHGQLLARRMKRLAPHGGEIDRNLDPLVREVQRQAEKILTSNRQFLARRDEQRMDLIEKL